jgi:hypothetical protein
MAGGESAEIKVSHVICLDLFHKAIVKDITSCVRVSVKRQLGVPNGDPLSQESKRVS